MSLDRIKRALFEAIEAVLGPRIDRCALYPGRIVSRTGGGPGGDPYSLEVQLDDPRWPPLTRVPLRPPIPGARVAPVPGSRVHVGWEEADPTKPYALPVWGTSERPELVIVDVGTSITLGNGSSPATKASNLEQHLSAISADLIAIASAAGTTATNYGTAAKEALDAAAPIAATKVLIE